MEVSITQPLGFSQLGSRANNEDTLFPDPLTANPQQRWFLVCDGVGGSERGEVASQLAVTEFDRYFRDNPVTTVTEDYIQQALTFVQDRFDEYVAANPQAESMGTTMTLVYRHEAGITVAHLGDSRVYLIRDGMIEWRTDDHSYVNELVKAGVLSADEARKHPQRNVITRAIQGGQKRAQADVQLLNDLQSGDYLFMCTDGILERISDELLEKTLGSSEPNDEKLRTLLACCYGHTRDNFTAYLLQVADVKGQVSPSARTKLPTYNRPESDDDDYSVTLIGVPRPEPLPSYANLNDAPNDVPARREPALPVAEKRFSPEPRTVMAPVSSIRQQPKKRQWMPWILVGLLLGAGCFALWYKFGHLLNSQSGGDTHPTKEITNSAIAPPPAEASVISNQPDKSLQTDPDSASVPSGSSLTRPKTVSASSTSETAKSTTIMANEETADKDGLTSVFKLDNRFWHLEVVRDGSGKRGLRAIEGTMIFEPQFDSIGLKQIKWGLIPVRLNNKKKYITVTPNWRKMYDDIGDYSESCNLIPVRRDGHWGYLNGGGFEVIKAVNYVKAGSFDDKKDCTAQVTESGGKQYRIHKDGTKVQSGKSK